jgi:hypothetical protein
MMYDKMTNNGRKKELHRKLKIDQQKRRDELNFSGWSKQK